METFSMDSDIGLDGHQPVLFTILNNKTHMFPH